MQPRFEHRRGNAPKRLMSHPRFRAAYDFLLLRAQAGEPVQELADWWTAAIAGEPPVVAEAHGGEMEPAPRRRRRRRRRGGGGGGHGGGHGHGPAQPAP